MMYMLCRIFLIIFRRTGFRPSVGSSTTNQYHPTQVLGQRFRNTHSTSDSIIGVRGMLPYYLFYYYIELVLVQMKLYFNFILESRILWLFF